MWKLNRATCPQSTKAPGPPSACSEPNSPVELRARSFAGLSGQQKIAVLLRFLRESLELRSSTGSSQSLSASQPCLQRQLEIAGRSHLIFNLAQSAGGRSRTSAPGFQSRFLNRQCGGDGRVGGFRGQVQSFGYFLPRVFQPAQPQIEIGQN